MVNILFILYAMLPLASPDGLACGGGAMFLCLEGAGTVLAFDRDLSTEEIFTGLLSPEGIAVLPDGSLLVTEDRPGGRILYLDGGEARVLASGMDCPEGVTADSSGTVWFTTGGLEADELLTSLWRIDGDGVPERVFSLPSVFSFSDAAACSDGRIYVASESAGLLGDVSVFAYDPGSDTLLPFAVGIPFCEGICLVSGSFPMYAVSERGRVFRVSSAGDVELIAEVPGTLEDVCLFHGMLYVSEDSTGTLAAVAP